METGNRVKENVGRIQVGAYGMGNFACQLSFTMVNMYLAYFYTDVFGLSAAAVATLLLVAKVWDGINDPMMGALMDKTYTRVGGYRTYMIAGAAALVVFRRQRKAVLRLCDLYRAGYGLYGDECAV